MARDINARLQRLKSRRSGTDRLMALDEAVKDDILAKSLRTDSWQKRSNRPYTQYALGAMQEVGTDYTSISLETARRVGQQLKTELASRGLEADFRLQGSVPLNVHIRGVSDVDLLTIDLGLFTYANSGQKAQAGHYQNPTTKTSLGVLTALRGAAESILKQKYPAATVDVSGGKAIKISGGSLARPVDVVPSHWHDTPQYQSSNLEHDRGVTILNKKVPETVANLPFLHIKTVADRDAAAQGSIKKSIRLCKHVKNDAESERGHTIRLPSYDIAAIMYYANLHALIMGGVYELGILAETQRHLDALYNNKQYTLSLVVPDGSRKIFDTEEKYLALRSLSLEIDDLAKEVAKEQNTWVSALDPSFSDAREILSETYIP